MDSLSRICESYSRPEIAVTFGHLFVGIHKRHYLGVFRLNVLHFWEKVSLELFVEPFRVLICEFDVLELVHPHWDVSGSVDQDIHRHEDWVGVESHAAVLMGLLFVLNHRVEPVLGSQTAQNPSQFTVSRDLRLNEEAHFVRVHS